MIGLRYVLVRLASESNADRYHAFIFRVGFNGGFRPRFDLNDVVDDVLNRAFNFLDSVFIGRNPQRKVTCVKP